MKQPLPVYLGLGFAASIAGLGLLAGAAASAAQGQSSASRGVLAGPETVVRMQGFRQQDSTGSCGGQTGCVVQFVRVPNAMQLVATSLSCHVALNGNASVYNMRLGVKSGSGTGGISTWLIPVPIGAIGSTRVQVVNWQGLHLFDGGEQPAVGVLVDGGTLSGVSCTIAGRLEERPPA